MKQWCTKVLYDTVKKCELDLEYDVGATDVKLSDAIRFIRYRVFQMINDSIQIVKKRVLQKLKGLSSAGAVGKPNLLITFLGVFRYSIETDGAMLNKVLKTKPYLRITMGKGMGESPGIPYVLEIWPKGEETSLTCLFSLKGEFIIFHQGPWRFVSLFGVVWYA